MIETVKTPVSDKSLIQQIIQETPPAPPEETKAIETKAPEKIEIKEESKSSKAAKESKALRAAKAELDKLSKELAAAKSNGSSAEAYAKVQELVKTNPKEALKLLGADPLLAYQAMTDAWLHQDEDMKAKDPVSEKLKEIDPYLETIKKREQELAEKINQEDVRVMITDHVRPILKEEEHECLFDFFLFDENGKERSKEERNKVLEKNIFDNAEIYFKDKLGSDSKRLLSEFGDYKVYFKKVADHLEKQLSERIDNMVQRAAKLSKFKNRFNSSQKPEAPVPDENSPEITLDAVINSKETKQNNGFDLQRKRDIEAFLKQNGVSP